MASTRTVDEERSAMAAGIDKPAPPRRRKRTLAVLGAALVAAGCTGPGEYIRNGFKVGPEYGRPAAPVAPAWIDAADKRVSSDRVQLVAWWSTFNDPVLDGLVQDAYRQNLTVREAAYRVLQARAYLDFTRGSLFPQQQALQGDFSQTQLSRSAANRGFLPNFTYSQWDLDFGLAWELDFWGRFRRAIEASDAQLDASVEDYDDVLVTLVGDVATNYVQLRNVEQQLAYVAANVELQRATLDIAKARFAGGQTTDLDVEQSQSVLLQTESQTPQLEIQRRQFNNKLCVLLGIPVEDLRARLGKGPIPTAPASVAVGIPAELLSRRPDVRRQERLAAAQAAQIGVAEADFYPAISIGGTVGYSAEQLPNLFTSKGFEGYGGPSFQWKILNYGRIASNVRIQEAAFQEAVANYRQTVLRADEEAENALVQFLRSQEQAAALAGSVAASEKAVTIATVQYKGGLIDFNRLSLVEQNLVSQQINYAQAQSNIALGLIQLYRALGGGWEIRLNRPAVNPVALPAGAPLGMPGAATEPVPGTPEVAAEPPIELPAEPPIELPAEPPIELPAEPVAYVKKPLLILEPVASRRTRPVAAEAVPVGAVEPVASSESPTFLPLPVAVPQPPEEVR